MSTLKFYLRFLLLALLALAGASSYAEASLRDEVDLMEALKKQPPCCVIDARSEASQAKHTLADALKYRPGLRIVPTASVVVVGDDNPAALKVAQALAKQHPDKNIYAVRGGVTAWEFVRKALDKVAASSSGAPPAGVSFVIPHNTCETGTPLQVLSGSTKAKP
ncbi:MAG: hypothetical protein Q8S51_00695 [Rhodoferax sp.]|uniref:hypothetical protein n=2 Tax=Rhodoferax sp. TaxID=50421 RepID=UPI002732ECA3|nr:hypothetical protein [Rhodoferax sp.]MDP3335286.1 hypothetical protein [Rhodoferax sp.]